MGKVMLWREKTVTREEFRLLGVDGLVALMKDEGFLFDSEACPIKLSGETEIIQEPQATGGAVIYRQRVT